MAEYKKKLDEVSENVESYEEAKKKTSHELDARQQTIDSLTGDNDKLNKSKKKMQSEVILSPCDLYREVWTDVQMGGSVAQWLGRWLVIERSRVRLPASPLPGNNSGQVVHTLVLLSPSSIIWYRPKGGDALRLGR